MLKKILILVLSLQITKYSFASSESEKISAFIEMLTEAQKEKLFASVTNNFITELAGKGACETIQSLVNQGYCVNGLPKNCPALIKAILNKKDKAAKLLIELNADIELPCNNGDESGVTPLMWAANLGRKKIVKLLLEQNANLEAKSSEQATALEFAIRANRTAIAKYLIQNKADINVKNCFGHNLLVRAVQNCNLKSAKFLLKYNLDIENISPANGNILHWAATEANPEIIDLFTKKLDINIVNEHGNTPLHVACLNDKNENIEYLIRIGAKLDIKNNYDFTPLGVALAEGHADISGLLILKYKDDFRSFFFGNISRLKPEYLTKAINCLISILGADYKDEHGQTFVHWAVKTSNWNVLEAVLEHEIDLDHRDDQDKTALDLALESNTNLVRFITEAAKKRFKKAQKKEAEKHLDRFLPKVINGIIENYLGQLCLNF